MLTTYRTCCSFVGLFGNFFFASFTGEQTISILFRWWTGITKHVTDEMRNKNSNASLLLFYFTNQPPSYQARPFRLFDFILTVRYELLKWLIVGVFIRTVQILIESDIKYFRQNSPERWVWFNTFHAEMKKGIARASWDAIRNWEMEGSESNRQWINSKLSQWFVCIHF